MLSPVAIDETPLDDVAKDQSFRLYWSHHIFIVCHTWLLSSSTMGNMTVTHVLHMCYIRVTHWSWSSPIENRSLVGFWGRSVVPQVSRIISRVHRWPSAVWTITIIEAWWVNRNNYYQLFSIIIITVLCPAIWKKSFLGYISKVTMRIVEEMMIMTIMMAGQQTILPKPLHYCGLVMITIITSTNNINGERKSFTFRGRSVADLINEWLHCKYIFVTCLFWQSSGLIIIVTSKSISLNFSLSACKCSKLTFRMEG